MKHKKTLIVVSDDKIGHRLAARLQGRNDCIVALDRTTGVARVVKLLRRGRLKFRDVLKMWWAEQGRKDTPFRFDISLETLDDFKKHVCDRSYDKVILFRCGVVVSAAILEKAGPIFNIHCASLPKYGGLSVIPRALRDQAWDQEACYYKIDERIDEGTVLRSKPYRLSPDQPYRLNEDIAYEAGMDVMMMVLDAS